MDATQPPQLEQTHPGQHSAEVELANQSPEPFRAGRSPLLPDIPSGTLSLDLDLRDIASQSPATSDDAQFQKLQKRASNVLKLSEENDKLKEELRAMTARLEAAERRKAELQAKRQQIMEPPST